MNGYGLLLLDADNTLFDFAKAQDFALRESFKAMGYPLDIASVHRYSQINERCWRLLEAGRITRSELAHRRFEEFLLDRQIDGVTPGQCNGMFLDYLSNASFLMDGAEELCRALHPHCTLAIATNGFTRVQAKRLEQSAIKPYISHMITSEAAGAEKPDRRFFSYALAQCGHAGLSGVLMVGDSLAADVRGAMAFGLDACWFCPEPTKTGIPEGCRVVTSLRDVIGIAIGT